MTIGSAGVRRSWLFVARRGKSFSASKFGMGSWGWAVLPAVTVLHVGTDRDLSTSADDGGGVGGEIDEWIGRESICCCVGFDGVLITAGLSFDDQP